MSAAPPPIGLAGAGAGTAYLTAAPSPSFKSQRVLACVLCQQRKVKCDRKFPCANCTKHNAQCVPATLTRPRRRRFPERELLDRLHKYEDLLRQNNIKFDPLHGGSSSVGEKESPEDGYASDEEVPTTGLDEASTVSAKSDNVFETKSIWQAITLESQEVNNGSEPPISVVFESTVKEAWDLLDDDEHILFASRKGVVDLSTFHPEPVAIFRLWQVYLDNVNPLLKVTHTPSLQPCIIQAASMVGSIEPSLEAVMFGIYSMAIVSLSSDECQTIFGLSKQLLLTKYQFGCQQALINARFLRSADRDCLTALYLYLLSIRSGASPRALCSMFGVAIRIAQYMGINNESSSAKYPLFEAEMRRRLWWSLMLYDSRKSEMADLKDMSLAPTWDCRVPLNLNDSDLRSEMKEAPADAAKITESLFVVVRSEIADFVRHSASHLEFSNPALKPLAKALPDGGSFFSLEKKIEEKYLRYCDPENPLHFMTIWMARGYLAKSQLFDHYAKVSAPNAQQTGEQRDFALSLAFKMLECDTKVLSSALTKRYLWLSESYFPFPAHIHIIQDLRQRPLSRQASQAWEIMYDNFKVRFPPPSSAPNPLIKMFGRTVMVAWEALKAAWKSEKPLTPPQIVLNIMQRDTLSMQATQDAEAGASYPVVGNDFDNFLTAKPMPSAEDSLIFGMGPSDYSAGDFMMGSPFGYPIGNEPAHGQFNLHAGQFS